MVRSFSLSVVILLFQVKAAAQVSPPGFSVKEGFYNNSLSLELTSSTPGGIIFYTTDGSLPSPNSTKYLSPIDITHTTVIKAGIFLSDSLLSSIVTSTYFINETHVLPVFSLSTDPGYFFDPDTGFYIHYSTDWEVPVHIEFFETNGECLLEMDAGAKIHGEGSRAFAQKSLVLFARNKYGTGKIKYRFFPSSPADEFESIILRSSGSDWNKAMFRDGFVHWLVKDLNIDVSAYRPSIVYINGDYWGIHNIREKTDEHYLEEHHGVEPDSVDISLYWGLQPDHGNYIAFHSLQSFFEISDFTKQEVYDSAKSMIDMDAWLNYNLTEIISDNTDWPANNVKSWRERKEGAKWRWILYDTDVAFDLYLRESYKHYSLDYALSPFGRDFYNYPHSILFLNKLLTNEQFKISFINRFADFCNSVFSKENMLKVLDELSVAIEPEIPRHFERWGDTTSNWYKHINAIRTFINERESYITQNFLTKFNLAGTAAVNVEVNDPAGGFVKLNSLELSEFPWMGKYFIGVPVTITAVPAAGYYFTGWEGINGSGAGPVLVPLESDVSIKANFQKGSSYRNIVINEINYNSAADFNPEDWVELYNADTADVNISGWKFTDSDVTHFYTFPDNTILGKDQYLVLCTDTIYFTAFFPDIKNFQGNMGFGLDGAGEYISLLDADNNIIDSLTYDDKYPWNPEADGDGKTLELRNPFLVNSNPLNWGVSAEHGTPGRINNSYTSAEEDNEIPSGFILYQNYPNPFNAATVIGYSLPQGQFKVTLSIFDILGSEIEVLVNEEKHGGIYEAKWNAGNLPSGVYFCQLQAGSLTQIKKMILMK